MKIEVFDYIERAISVLDSERENFERTANRIVAVLKKMLAGLGGDLLDVTCRVKEDDSLREKILRKNLYKLYPADRLAFEVHDIIGVRIECRFLEDEKRIYEHLKRLFAKSEDGIYFYIPGKDRLRLKLGAPQPEIQQNGFEIYRIDGLITTRDFTCNFELQIKSLVNAFWSEIEHKLIYKNKRVMMIDGFVSEQMNALNRSLYLIDKQLNALYNRCLDESTTFRRRQIENMMVIFINELFTRVVKDNIGFEVGIKPLAESVVQYVFSGSSFSIEDDTGVSYGRTLERTLDWIRKIDFDKVRIGDAICFENPPEFSDPVEAVISQTFYPSLNEDFFCNLFFHILFSIEVGNNLSDYRDYVRYYRRRIAGEDSSSETAQRLRDILSGTVPGSYLLTEEGIAEIRQKLRGDAG